MYDTEEKLDVGRFFIGYGLVLDNIVELKWFLTRKYKI